MLRIPGCRREAGCLRAARCGRRDRGGTGPGWPGAAGGAARAAPGWRTLGELPPQTGARRARRARRKDAPIATALDTIDQFIQEQGIDTEANGWRTRLPRPPEAEFGADEGYLWELETSLGTILVRLRADVAPMHVSSTIYLTRLGFYDDLVFHRVIPGFMAQGGCPNGIGNGGPGYQYAGEFGGGVKHDRPGLLSMANAGPNTDGSQFFLTFVPTPWLDGNHTIFGEVMDGMDVLQALEERGSDSGRPSERVVITQATVRAA